MKPFCSGLLIDADYTPHGWEIGLRFDVESLEEAFAGVSDADLPGIVGEVIARLLIAERDRATVEA